MMEYDMPLYRPPSEADSLILQATIGCSHNRCRFCYMYKDKSFRARPWASLKADIDGVSGHGAGIRRVFLADGDAFSLSTARLEEILEYLGRRFPDLQRVSAYANPSSLLAKSVPEMERLRGLKLSILYYGVETGDPALLEKIDKGATPDEMAEGCDRASEAGIKLSVTVVLGLGGRGGSLDHAVKTAGLVSRISPRYLSALTLMLGPYAGAYAGAMGPGFEFNDPIDDVKELRTMVEHLELDRCIFRSNHASNHLALAGTLSRDRQALLGTIDLALARPRDYFRDERLRGL
ncbi:MAG: radical SAM protein [Candidatus Krumholzibacteria bacterium]|nr:radical SAM protein [Candidatus Krumholzibacteria bacterium]